MGTELAVAGLIASIVGTGASMKNASNARKAGKEQAAVVKAQNAAAAAQSRRTALREERVRRAQVIAESELLGVSGSSSAISGEAMPGTAARENISQTSGRLSATNAISSGNQAIASAQARQQLFSNVASIGSSVFSATDGTTKIKSLFD